MLITRTFYIVLKIPFYNILHFLQIYKLQQKTVLGQLTYILIFLSEVD